MYNELERKTIAALEKQLELLNEDGKTESEIQQTIEKIKTMVHLLVAIR